MGVTASSDNGQWPVGCWPFDTAWSNRTTVRNLLWKERYHDFERLLLADEKINLRLQYTWSNVTALVPNPQGREWEDLALIEEFRNKSCGSVPNECTGIKAFLKAHIVQQSIKEKRKGENNGKEKDLVGASCGKQIHLSRRNQGVGYRRG